MAQQVHEDAFHALLMEFIVIAVADQVLQQAFLVDGGADEVPFGGDESLAERAACSGAGLGCVATEESGDAGDRCWVGGWRCG